MATESKTESKTEFSVWRLSLSGLTIISVDECNAARMAEVEPDAIYFYGELGAPSPLKLTQETMVKVHQALGSVGMSENQIINAVNGMQSAGIYFRESAI